MASYAWLVSIASSPRRLVFPSGPPAQTAPRFPPDMLLRLPSWLLLLLPVALLFGSPLPAAQSAGRKYHTDEYHGFRFKPLKDFDAVPVAPGGGEGGLAARFGGPEMIVEVEDRGRFSLDTHLWVYAMEEEEFDEDERERSTTRRARRDIVEAIAGRLPWMRDIKEDPVEDEELTISKVETRHRYFEGDAGGFQMAADVWTFRLDHADVSLVYIFGAERSKKWLPATKKSAKSFQLVDRVIPTPISEGGGSYEDQLAAAQARAEQTPPWRALPTPSRKFIIVTSSDNDRFLKEVIDRLEKSREVFEEDFPPPADFDAVSIVRVCDSEEEFHTYGGTGGGVAGWFNPGSTELVLYDAVNVDRNSSYAVMSHEAFHQYCHFLFGQSEAHRWFDEGHGDYYGGIEIKGSRVKITPTMPAGLNRLPVIKQMAREGTYKPVEEHINYSHREWQSQGPSNVSCYAQSWSIIYYLRQGTLGKVGRRYWRKEYEGIIPGYVETLAAGFSEAYAEILAERQERADSQKRELTAEERDINRQDLSQDQKLEIWKAAMDASWGKVDLDQFQEDWLVFVDKEL